MKKNILLITICLLLVGCGTSKEFTMEEGTKTIESKLNEMSQIEDSTLTDAYNLDLSSMKEYTFKQNSDGDFYAIIKPIDKQTVKSNMNTYFERVKDFNSSYSPKRLEILENRTEKEVGEYLIYIVSSNSNDIYQDILKVIE